MANETAGQKAQAEVTALLRARNALLWISSPEEVRVRRAVVEAAAGAKYETRIWTCSEGVTDATGKEVTPGRQATDPAVVLKAIADSRQRAVWVLQDLAPWLRDPNVCRALRSLAQVLPSTVSAEARAIVVLSPTADVPPELQDHAVVIKWQLPDRAEIGAIFDGVLAGVAPNVAADIAGTGVREAAIEAAVGLSAESAAACYAKSLVTQGKKIVPAVVAAEKKRVINREKGIEWFDPDPRGLDAIGGLDVLKEWLVRRKSAFSQRARDFGLPLPKGALMLGPPGCLHADTPIYDPVDGSTKSVRDRYYEGVDFHVTAMAESGAVVAIAERPYVYPRAKMIKFSLSNGETITVTEGHRFLVAPNVWWTAAEVRERLRAGERVRLVSSSGLAR